MLFFIHAIVLRTGEVADVPAKSVPFFKAGKEFKEIVDAD